MSSITATPRTTSGSESAASFWRPRASPPFTIPPRLQFGGRSQPGQGVDDEDEDDDRVDDDVAFPTSEHESRYEVEDSEEEDDDGDDEDEGGDGGDASTMQTATAGDKNAAASTSTAGTRKRKRRRRRAADGDDDVYSDFGLIFGTGRGGPAGGDRSGTGEELDLDVDAAVGAGTAEHFYEGYLDELDGIWARV